MVSSEKLVQWAKDEGFFLAAVSANRFNVEHCLSLLAVGLVYGNVFDGESDGGLDREGETLSVPAVIAPFARRNYYRAAVFKLQNIAKKVRGEYGGMRADYRIYCNSFSSGFSRVDEKTIAFESGMADRGRNTLLLTRAYGSLFVAGILTLPFETDRRDDASGRKPFALCAGCDPENPPCKTACPTGAITGGKLGDSRIERERCIQWYLSGHGERVPAFVKKHWGNRLYGCTLCQDACIYHKKPIRGIGCSIGVLPAVMDARKIADASGEDLKTMFHGTALGLSWLCPDGLKRNAEMCLGR